MEQILHLINEMSPFLLLGFLLAGLMHAFIPGQIYSRYLAKPTFSSVLYSALFGIPLPLCSCGVIPTAMSLRKEGASKGAVASFLIATPQTGVDSIIATYSLMGLPFAIARPIIAFVTALFGGQMVNMADKDPSPALPREGEESQHNKPVEAHCECGCGHNHEHSHEHEHSFIGKIKEALSYAFLEMMEDIGKWLMIGLIVAGLITVLVPDSFFEVFKDNSLASMLLVLAFAIPMYLCATGSIPIAVALMLKGLTPGSALVLLMAGPACNMASIGQENAHHVSGKYHCRSCRLRTRNRPSSATRMVHTNNRTISRMLSRRDLSLLMDMHRSAHASAYQCGLASLSRRSSPLPLPRQGIMRYNNKKSRYGNNNQRNELQPLSR